MSQLKIVPPALGTNGEVKTAGVRLETIECWARRGAIAAIVCAACLIAIAAVQVGEAARFAWTRAAFRQSMEKADRDMAKIFAPRGNVQALP